MDDGGRVYIAIDLKSFYASVECVERKLDPLTTNLVVADPTRTEKTICLAVTPALKACGISGRARLFEVVHRVEEINRERLAAAVRSGRIQKGADGKYDFVTESFDANALAADPALKLGYYVAPPRMKLYERYSARIFSIYTKYIAPEDIIVYSIDEIFADATRYLRTQRLSARELAMAMIREVLYTTGITATAGVGTNLYLAKVAMDIVAKRAPADRDGVRLAELDERSYREKLWCHKPITDFWRVGRGTARRLEALGCFTMGDVARLSEQNESALYRAFGVNAELLIDHAWGWEPTTVDMVKAYRPVSKSLSSGQVLKEPYDFDRGRLIVREMTELLALELVKKQLVTKKLELTISYDRESLTVLRPGTDMRDTVYAASRTGRVYTGAVTPDLYGRPHPGHAHGTGKLDRWTSSTKRIMDAVLGVYDRVVDPDLLIRRVNLAAVELVREDELPQEAPEQLSLFADCGELEARRARERADDEKERRLQKATLRLQQKYGRNAVLKGMNLLEGGTTIERNRQIGGHRSGEEDRT